VLVGTAIDAGDQLLVGDPFFLRPLIDWQIDTIEPTTGFEFYVWLRRGGINAVGDHVIERQLDVRAALHGRPTKRHRRKLDRFTREPER
jgi:hypothetical protein